MASMDTRSTRESYPDAKTDDTIIVGNAGEISIIDYLMTRGVRAEKLEDWRQGDLRDQFGNIYEIKIDSRATDTKRLSIEIAERTAIDRSPVPSGIYCDNDARFYVQITDDTIFVFERETLRALSDGRLAHWNRPTVCAFFLSIDEAHAHALRIIDRAHQERDTIVVRAAWLFRHKQKPAARALLREMNPTQRKHFAAAIERK